MKLSKGWAIVFGFGSLTLILGLSYGATLPNLPHLAHLPMALVAWGTILLAFATFSLIRHSKEQEDRRRQEEQAKEKRDRNELLLNEIIEWAEDVAKLNFKIYNFVEAQISKESWVENGIGEIVSQFQLVEAKGDYINSIALSSFKVDKKLSKDIKAVNKEIRELVDVSVKRMDGEVSTEAVQERMNILRLKIMGLFKEAAKIKGRNII